MTTETLYAYVENNQIKECPVTRQHIENRGHPVTMYIEVEQAPLPELGKFKTSMTTYHHMDGIVKQYHAPRNLTIGELFARIYEQARAVDPTVTEVLAADADQDVIKKLADEYLDGYVAWKLEQIVKEAGWTSLDRVLSMKTSSNDFWRQEAEFAQRMYDKAYEVVHKLITEMKAGTAIVPATRQAFDDLLSFEPWPVRPE